jgi:hypothetical protein
MGKSFALTLALSQRERESRLKLFLHLPVKRSENIIHEGKEK